MSQLAKPARAAGSVYLLVLYNKREKRNYNNNNQKTPRSQEQVTTFNHKLTQTQMSRQLLLCPCVLHLYPKAQEANMEKAERTGKLLIVYLKEVETLMQALDSQVKRLSICTGSSCSPLLGHSQTDTESGCC